MPRLLLLLAFSMPVLSFHAQDQTYKKWLDEDVRYIITAQERQDFTTLTSDKQRDQFVIDFWQRRDPTPGTPENEFKEEHYRRIAYSNVHFAEYAPGWKSDRGHLYIVYGPPDRIDSYPPISSRLVQEQNRTNPSEAHEIWHYLNIGPDKRAVDVMFVDKCRCGQFELKANPLEKHNLP